MALRSRSRTATPTSGPGRGPASDTRTRHRRQTPARGRARARQRYASAEELRRRAEVIFAERAGERRESGTGPPDGERWSGPDEGADEAGWGGYAHEVGARAVGAGSADGGRGAAAGLSTDGGEADVPAGAVVGAGGASAGGNGSAGGTADRRHAQVDWADVASAPGDWRGRAGLALRERMPVWLQARCGVERRSVVALAVLLVVAAGFAVQHFWAGRTQDVRAPEVVAAPYGGERAEAEAGGSASASAGAPNAAGTAGTAGTSVAEIVVDVSGKVREPGIHRLPAGARVADALRAAGGVRPGTDTVGLNRARFLVDGEQVVVGGPAVPGAGAAGTAAGGAAGGVVGAAGGLSGAGGSVPGAGSGAPVSLNTATVEQLDTLPGVGPVLAQHILDYRTQHGGFRSVDELREVNGIGARRFADLRNLVRP
ncbi:ComEA family DNA-binding protein [Streptomyces sp. S.PB5]|uniref:ComEA family DNA-binding protein n=1 Tax=Streptomyces sp. S.PB5 TaxID=3020844 RepID=UPI0025B263BB|nr:ComEA family DNA-binding protein [Streptomyces sp. S.PB5]MDN3022966.1 ComEA family DNA-binding protein [Streptomyces sp. S.PB5]